ncbi:CBS domain-containing protein [Candidatus Saccharibacteria bacterium]|nr:CBS domain-containing protein [Candidatus Saccharibacteria bacterium]
MSVALLLALLFFVALLLVAAITPNTPRQSMFELKRLGEAGNKDAALDLQREALRQDILSVQRVILSVLLVAFVLATIAAFGWVIGSIIAVGGALQYSSLSRIHPFRHQATALYNRYEAKILATIERYQKGMWWLRSVAPEARDARLGSKSELEHFVLNSGSILSEDEKKLIVHSLRFDQRQVKDVMTPRSMVAVVKKNELLGPLVLDDLHKSGHSRFPVIDEDIDHVVGMLYLRNVLTLDTARRHTATAETAMEKHVYFVHEQQNLAHALSAFLKTHHHLFIVVNEFRETVGILSLEDTIEALIGRTIVDEFDAHDDLRAVAARAPKGNPKTATSKDV